MPFGLDYSTPVTDRAKLTQFKQAGVTFVARYISTPGNMKNVTAGEVAALKGAGLGLIVVFETTANRALSGYQAGQFDATSATSQINTLGLRGIPVYFAVDFDATSSYLVPIGNYFKGAASVLGHDRVGVYGGIRAVAHILDQGICKWAWQTYAWSGGQWDHRAHLQQYENGKHVARVSVDYDRSMTADFGQWPRPATPTVVTHYAPPWTVTVNGKYLTKGRLINPFVVQKIVAPMKAAGFHQPWPATVDGKLYATGRFIPPGNGWPRALGIELRAGKDIGLPGGVVIHTRRV